MNARHLQNNTSIGALSTAKGRLPGQQGGSIAHHRTLRLCMPRLLHLPLVCGVPHM
jgi:hypothetical protein